MPDLHLVSPVIDGNLPRFRYVWKYRDRHGRLRRYFRRRGMPLIPLPGQPGSPQFLKAYQAALGEPLPSSAIRKAKKRLTQNIRQKQPLIGVYLLLKAGELTYIGESTNMQQRVADHKRNGREFDQAFFIKTTLGQRAALERALIRSFQPRQNRSGR